MNTIRAAILVALAVGASCNDLRAGADYGKIIFNETIQASPAIWRQSQQVAVNVSDQETISGVVVTDNRENKDGEATIIDGGEGQQKVTIELKSPAVFRGFDFQVTVYATEGAIHPINYPQHPAVMTKDIDVNKSVKPENRDNAATVSTTDTQNKGPAPADSTGELFRKTRSTENPDAVVKFVTQKSLDDQSTTEVSSTTEQLPTDFTIDKGLKINGVAKTDQLPTDFMTNRGLKVSGAIVPANLPKLDFTTGASSTTFDDVTTSTTEKTHEKMIMQNFDSISKELGQKVVFGIKKH